MRRQGVQPESKNNVPDVAVVMVTFNSGDDVSEALPSLQQSLAGLASRIIIVDNASADGTREYLQQWCCQSDSHVYIQNESNRGYTAAINQGLRHTDSSRMVLLLNPDVLIPDPAIRILVDCLQANDHIGVVAPQLRFMDGTIQPSCRRFPRRHDVFLEPVSVKPLQRLLRYKDWKMSEFDHTFSRPVDQPQGAFLLAKRQVLDQVGVLDERFYMFFSDVDWCYRIQQAGWQIYFCCDTLVYHKKGSSIRRSRPAMLVTSHRSFADYFAKHADGFLAKFGTKIVTLWLLVMLGPRLLFEQWRNSRSN
jgi:GT2 family glycosyltransferase